MNKLPTDATERKTRPVYSGFVDYFPDAMAAVSHLSYIGNQQHHPDKPLHWDKSKSSDELDALMRHMIDGEWVHVAWRAMANLQRQIDAGWVPFGDVEESAPLVRKPNDVPTLPDGFIYAGFGPLKHHAVRGSMDDVAMLGSTNAWLIGGHGAGDRHHAVRAGSAIAIANGIK